MVFLHLICLKSSFLVFSLGFLLFPHIQQKPAYCEFIVVMDKERLFFSGRSSSALSK